MKTIVEEMKAHFALEMEAMKNSTYREYRDGYSFGLSEAVGIMEAFAARDGALDMENLRQHLEDEFDDTGAIDAMSMNSSCLGGLEIEMANGTFDAHKDVLRYLADALEKGGSRT